MLRAQSFFEECPGFDERTGPILAINEGVQMSARISKNETHRWLYSNFNLTNMDFGDETRKLMVSLEPCYGSVKLFMRKNIACHPDPYSCIGDLDLPPDQQRRQSTKCKRTHFMSDISASQDGAPTFFEVSLSATRYFISVYATEDSMYKLTVLADVGAFPRSGGNGTITTSHLNNPGEVMIQWAVADYFPVNVSETLEYSVYALDLADTDKVVEPKVFLRSNRILNTVCGLENNTDSRDDRVTPEMCSFGWCNMTFTGLVNGRKYAFNVVAESQRGYKFAYAGALFHVDEEIVGSVGGGARRLMEGTIGSAVDADGIGRVMDHAVGGARLLMEMPQPRGSGALDEFGEPPLGKQVDSVRVVAAVLSSVIGVSGMLFLVAAKALFTKQR